MDFGTLLHRAQRNENSAKKEVRCYKATFDPPKKEQKAKTLSANIQKFLARKEEEEKRKIEEAKRKRDELLALRSQDGKAKKRVAAMLNRTKAANKAAIEDAVDNENTAVTLGGLAQPDEDDYGYVSQEASAFYNKLMEKYQSTPSEETKNPKKALLKSSASDLNNTKDRVRMALLKVEEEEMMPHKRKRKTKEEKLKESEGGERASDQQDYEDAKDYEEEKRAEKPAKPRRPPAPPPMDFHSLLKLAEKKQFEPIKIEPKVKDEDEDARPMTKKQRAEYEREREWRMRKEGKLPPLSSSQGSSKEQRSRDQKNSRPPDQRNARPVVDQRNRPDVNRELQSNKLPLNNNRDQGRFSEGNREQKNTRPSGEGIRDRDSRTQGTGYRDNRPTGELSRERDSRSFEDGYRERDSYRERESQTYGDGYRERDSRPPGGGYRENRPSSEGFRDRDNRPSGDSYRERDSRPYGDGYRERDGQPSGDGYRERERPSGDGYRERESRPSGDDYRETRPSGDGYQNKISRPDREQRNNRPMEGSKDQIRNRRNDGHANIPKIPKLNSSGRDDRDMKAPQRIPKFSESSSINTKSAKLQGNSDSKVGKDRNRNEVRNGNFSGKSSEKSRDEVRNGDVNGRQPMKSNQKPSSSASGLSSKSSIDHKKVSSSNSSSSNNSNLSSYSKKLQESLLSKLQEKKRSSGSQSSESNKFRVPDTPVPKLKNREGLFDNNKGSKPIRSNDPKELMRKEINSGKNLGRPLSSSQRPNGGMVSSKSQESLQKNKPGLPDRRPAQMSSKDVKPRQFPPSDVKPRQFPPPDVKPRQFPPADVRPRQFPPADVRSRQFPPADVRRKPKPQMKRRIMDSDEEYDSELDDFIDDGPVEEEDYSKHIREIFNYDKSRYRDMDDDDECMESSFSQQLKEEFVSTKLGLMEDLEDMALEKKQLEKKKKSMMMKKKRRL